MSRPNRDEIRGNVHVVAGEMPDGYVPPSTSLDPPRTARKDAETADGPEIYQRVIAALTRAIDAGQVEVYMSGGKGRIEFTDDSFQEWYLAETQHIAARASQGPADAQEAGERGEGR